MPTMKPSSIDIVVSKDIYYRHVRLSDSGRPGGLLIVLTLESFTTTNKIVKLLYILPARTTLGVNIAGRPRGLLIVLTLENN